jgi:mannose-6-phosphate isomerase-like protein (cupin superfamily)
MNRSEKMYRMARKACAHDYWSWLIPGLAPSEKPGVMALGVPHVDRGNPAHHAPSKNFGITMLYVPPQGSVATGSHEPEEVYAILEGQGTMQFAQYKRQVKKGDFIYLPAWCVHGIENTGTEMLIVLVATSPTNP